MFDSIIGQALLVSAPFCDSRRTEQCIIPYATQEGEISFGASYRMMKLYRQHVLNEEPQSEMVQLSGIALASKEAGDREEVGSFGD